MEKKIKKEIEKLAYVCYSYKRKVQEEEKQDPKRRWYPMENDCSLGVCGAGYVKLKDFHTPTLEQCKELYEKSKFCYSEVLKFIKSINPPIKVEEIEKEKYITEICINLSEYKKYDRRGEGVESINYEDDIKGKYKLCSYYPQENRLEILEEGILLYENNNGVILDNRISV